MKDNKGKKSVPKSMDLVSVSRQGSPEGTKGKSQDMSTHELPRKLESSYPTN